MISLVNWMNTKSMIMILIIDNGNTTNTVDFNRRKKDQEGKVKVKVSAMVQLYSKYKKETNFLDQKKRSVHIFERKSLGYIIADLFGIVLQWDW